jgi:phage tail sheath gpL-like
MSSPNISFETIPSTIRTPGIYSEFNLNASRRALPANDQKTLVIAQRIATPVDWTATAAKTVGAVVKPTAGKSNGHYYVCVAAGSTGAAEPTWPLTGGATVVDGTVTWMEYVASALLVPALNPTRVFGDAEAQAIAGAGSQAHMMAAAAFAANRYLDLTLCTVEDAEDAVKASGTVAMTGTATSSGMFYLYIGNVRIAVAIESGDTAAAIATAINAAIVSKKHLLPVIPSVASGTVTLTAKNGGTLGNQIPLEYSCSASGVSVALGAMANGAVDPDLGAVSGALDTVFAGKYSVIVSALNDATTLADLRSHLDAVSGSMEQRPAVGVFGYTDKTGNLAAVKTLCATSLNHWRLSCAYLPNTRSLSCEVAAGYGAVIASQSDAALPYNDLPIEGLNLPASDMRLSGDVIRDLLASGVAPLAESPGERVGIVRAITTYVRDAQGVDDPTLLDITTPRTLDYVQASCRSRISAKFPRTKKTDRVKKAVRSELLDTLYELESLEQVEDVDDWKEYLIYEDDLQDAARTNFRIPAKIVRGLHVIANRIDLL